MKKALFLDRDGTINVDKHYVYKKEDFVLIKGVTDAIKRYSNKQFVVIVVTNQSGIGRGLFTEADMLSVHKYAEQLMATEGVKIDKWYYCPHHPIYGIGRYKIECNCRKPNTGMLEQAIKEFDIDVGKSLLVGDKESDIKCGQKMGIRSIYIEQFLCETYSEK